MRLISATNKMPESEIASGRFREDLLYRINTLTMVIPPIRERKEDLPGLIDFFPAQNRDGAEEKESSRWRTRHVGPAKL